MAAVLLPVMLTACSFALQASLLYSKHLAHQRVADMAAMAAANTGDAVSSGTISATAEATAKAVMVLNGYPATDVSLSVVESTDQQKRIKATVASQVPLIFGGLLGAASSTAVSASSVATTAGVGECFTSLGDKAEVRNDAKLYGPDCNISAGTYFFTTGNAVTSVSTIQVAVSKSANLGQWTFGYKSLSPGVDSFKYNTASTDPLSGDSRLTSIKALLRTVATWTYGTTAPLTPSTVSISAGSADRTLSNTTATVSSQDVARNLTLTTVDLNISGTGVADPNCTAPVGVSGTTLLYGVVRIYLGSGCYVFNQAFFVRSGASVVLVGEAGANVTIVFNSRIALASGTSLIFGRITKLTFNGDVEVKGTAALQASAIHLIMKGTTSIESGRLTYYFGNLYMSSGKISVGTGTLFFNDGNIYAWNSTIENTSTGTMRIGAGSRYLYASKIYNNDGTMTFGDGNFYAASCTIDLDYDSTTHFGKGDFYLKNCSTNLHGAKITFGGSVAGSDTSGDKTLGVAGIYTNGGTFEIKAKQVYAYGITFGFYETDGDWNDAGYLELTAPRSSSPTYGYSDILVYNYSNQFLLDQDRGYTALLSGIIYVDDTTQNASIEGYGVVTYPSWGCLQMIGKRKVEVSWASTVNLKSCTGTKQSAKLRY